MSAPSEMKDILIDLQCINGLMAGFQVCKLLGILVNTGTCVGALVGDRVDDEILAESVASFLRSSCNVASNFVMSDSSLERANSSSNLAMLSLTMSRGF